MKTFLLQILFLATFIGQSGLMTAQTTENKPQPKNKWMNEVRNFKHSFLVKETEMTEEQSKEFIPLYTEMENKIYQVNSDARKIEQETSRSQKEISDDEYFATATALSKVKSKEAEIEDHYFTLFSKILSKKQLFLLKRAEKRFTLKMLNHNKRSKKLSKEQNN